MSASTPTIGPEAEAPTAVIHVAAGIITSPQGAILIAQRPHATHQGGKWEFPGGKVRAREGVLQALVRELDEELGIRVQTAHPFLRNRHAYEDRTVLLDVWRVTAYQGSPQGREGQRVRWIPVSELESYDFPAADLPILRALRLPSLYLISDARRLGAEAFLESLERALRAGARLVQLREKHLAPGEYLELARRVVALAHRHDARVLLNADPDMVAATGADGVHLTSQRLRAARVRPLPPDLLVAASCHDAAELAFAQSLEADFAVVSPIARTTSHPDATPLGWEGLHELLREAYLPVYALGGMQAADLGRACELGAHGLALLSGVWGSAAPETVVAGFARYDRYGG